MHADGFFEFVIQRGNTKFCIVEAKKSDFDQGEAQALIGCEAIADREGLETVYGIVTDFVRWSFYRSGETKIKKDSVVSKVYGGVPEFASVKLVCELLYGFLSQEQDDDSASEKEENAGSLE